MAGKRKDQAVEHVSVYVGIDPGDRWCGMAILRVTADECQAQMAVLDRNLRNNLKEMVDYLTPRGGSTSRVSIHVITESFKMRPQGHQAWGSGETLQLIGAIRYACEDRGIHWTEVAPGDPDKELDNLGLGRYLQAWRPHTPNPGDVKWHHARSAWRCIGRYLMVRNELLLRRLRSNELPELTFDGKGATDGFDLIASHMTWKTP